ncbi:hypothetical protein M0Q97_02805 [Candidatus Dojkabacteria bacterium]|nr:hypothetical protein [Candidatus Dojkabacteria bacterium]
MNLSTVRSLCITVGCDRIAIIPTPWWIRCNCGRTGVSDTNKQTAIDNWNNDKLEWQKNFELRINVKQG